MVDFNTDGAETFTISATGTYQITAIGATGGSASGSGMIPNVGGEGASVTGMFSLSSGDVIDIVVGQAGGSSVEAGGGGGATFVYDDTTGTLMEVAGGGGGASAFAGGNGGNAETGTSGGPQTIGGVSGGTAGNGGGAEDLTDYAGAGAGVIGNGGVNSLNTDHPDTAGMAYVFGAMGGNGYAGGVAGSGDGGGGGGGGGGGAGESMGGGGGGYSGGGAGIATLNQAAGGGGSYIDPGATHADIFDVDAAGDGTAGLPGFTSGAIHDGYVDISCFLAGTRIATPKGERPVETLKEGDLILTAFGDAEPITWVGRTTAPARQAPIRIAKGALTANTPHRDLFVSPDHAMFLNDVFVPARLLVNGRTITQPPRAIAVEYHHIEVEPHAVILAEGAMTESFLDVGHRARFMHKAVVDLHLAAEPKDWEDAAAPLILAGPKLMEIRAELCRRAAAVPLGPQANIA